MQVNYCDLCATPLKDNNYYILYISEPRKYDDEKDSMDYTQLLNKVKANSKDICPQCKQIFDNIFELRLQRLSELAIELKKIYELPSKNNLKSKKNEKNKK